MSRGQDYHCGSKNSPKWLRRILSVWFNEPCRLHDKDYNVKTKKTRKEADNHFKKRMLRVSKNNKLLIVLAHIYYIAVRLFGRKKYKGEKNVK